MTAPTFDLATTVRHPPDSAALQAADRAVAAALESARADSTNRVYRTQWRSFSSWCSDVGLRPLPADPLTVARYLGVRSEAGASMATLRQAASAITRVHEWMGHPSPCQDPGVRESLKGWARRLARPQRQAGALTSDVLEVIRLTAGKPRPSVAVLRRCRPRPLRRGAGGRALRRRPAPQRGRRAHLGQR